MDIFMPKITPHLCFNDQAEEAVQFYVSIFKNSAILNRTYYDGKGGAACRQRENDTISPGRAGIDRRKRRTILHVQ